MEPEQRQRSFVGRAPAGRRYLAAAAGAWLLLALGGTAGAAPRFGAGSGVSPPLMGPLDPYCKAGGNAGSTVWVERLDFDRMVSPSGRNGGYYVSSSREVLSYLAGDVVTVRGEPGYGGEARPVSWQVWLDSNLDSVFSEDERVLSMEGTGVVEGSFVIPEVEELTRLRVVMSTDAVTSPCGEGVSGEVEDYWLTAVKDPYCEVRGLASGVWIEAVTIDEYLSETGRGTGYSRQNEEVVYHLPETVSYRLLPGVAEAGTAVDWMIAIDGNGDGTFGDDEVVVELGGVVGEQTGAFLSPPILPVTRMRVIATRAGEGGLMCGDLMSGEVEDYWITTAPVPPQEPWVEYRGIEWGGCVVFIVHWGMARSKWGREVVLNRFFRDTLFNREWPGNYTGTNWTAGLLPEETYVVEGSAVDDVGLESPRSKPVVARTPACESLASRGPIRILGVLVSFRGAPQPLFAPDELRDRLFGEGFSVKSYYAEASYGRTEITGEATTSWLALSGIAEDYCWEFGSGGIALGRSCDRDRIISEARELATNAGYSTDFDVLVVFVNGMVHAFGGWDGVIAGATETYSSYETLIHELGHVLNIDHMGGWMCPGPLVGPSVFDLTAGGCIFDQYADSYDPLGQSARHFSVLTKLRLGLIMWEHFVRAVAPVYGNELGTAQEFELDPLELPGGQTYGLVVPLGHGDKSFYAVEYRIPVGIDGMELRGEGFKLDGVSGPPIHGLQVRLQREEYYQIEAYYIPTTVDESTAFDDPYRRIRIEALELGERARVRVTYYEGKLGDRSDWDEGCKSGHSVDGYCCESACTGQCEACDVAGHEGECVAVEGAPHGDRLSCGAEGKKSGRCDGWNRDACIYPEPQPEGCGCAGGEGAPAMVILVMASMLVRRLRRRSERG